jgi:hypothetical protein
MALVPSGTHRTILHTTLVAAGTALAIKSYPRIIWSKYENIHNYAKSSQDNMAECSLTYIENTWNETVRILRILGMKLYVYWEYLEWNCTSTENTWYETDKCRISNIVYCQYLFLSIRGNGAVCILITCRMKLTAYWEYAESNCSYAELKSKFKSL